MLISSLLYALEIVINFMKSYSETFILAKAKSEKFSKMKL